MRSSSSALSDLVMLRFAAAAAIAAASWRVRGPRRRARASYSLGGEGRMHTFVTTHTCRRVMVCASPCPEPPGQRLFAVQRGCDDMPACGPGRRARRVSRRAARRTDRRPSASTRNRSCLRGTEGRGAPPLQDHLLAPHHNRRRRNRPDRGPAARRGPRRRRGSLSPAVRRWRRASNPISDASRAPRRPTPSALVRSSLPAESTL